MAVRKIEEIMEVVQSLVGDSTDDKTISFIEDVKDTLTFFKDKSEKGDNEDWERKYKENDEGWRKKYRDRFFSSEDKEDDKEGEFEERKEKKSFNELFEEEE